MPRCHRQSGQAMIFVIMVLVVLAFVVMWHFDLHKTLYVKILSRDATDAAALSAARWQGQTLNLIGDLNVMQAALVSEALARGETDFPEAEALHDLRQRLNFVGPAIGLVAANQAAHQNRIYNQPVYRALIQQHAQRIRQEYARQFVPPWTNPDPDRTAWDDYADMLETIASHGLAIMPDNASWYFDYMDHNHVLLTPAFYDAVASGHWCWFFFNHMALLENYRSWRDWSPLPAMGQREPINAEVFSLRLTTVQPAAQWPALNPFHPTGRVDEWRDRAAALAGRAVLTNAVLLDVSWHLFNPSDWYAWSDFTGPNFPFQSPIRDVYNVLGADAAVRMATAAERITPGTGESSIRRSAAAKPFGALSGAQRINAYGMVLPGFTDVRLIPMDASTAPEGGSEEGWPEHIYEHLPRYLRYGVSALTPGCYYCHQLRRWEDPALRQAARAWLENNSQTCLHTGPGGGGPGGGARRGH